ncbi:MAG: CsbD family protein [Reyranella sp.]|nr:CsbD family protein [Reyranella sp.]
MRNLVLGLLGASVIFAAPFSPADAQTKTGTPAEREAADAWAKIKGAWTQSAGAVKEQWGKLTDDDVAEVDGRREQLIGKLQTRYGVSREEAERQVRGWEARYR